MPSCFARRAIAPRTRRGHARFGGERAPSPAPGSLSLSARRAGAQAPGTIRAPIESAADVLVLAPALPSRWDWLISNTDKAREIADERLRGVLDQIDESVARAKGMVGADDP